MATLCNRRQSVKPVRPVSGGCRWVGSPMVVGYRPGRLSITSHTRGAPVTAEYLVTWHSDHTGRVVGYRLTRDDGESHDIDADLWQCGCLDFLQRAAARVKAGLPAACKHVLALQAALPKCPILI